MLQVVSLPSALVRSVADVKGGTFMAIAACVVAATPSAIFDKATVKAWTGWNDEVVTATQRLMRSRGWLTEDNRLAGMPADLLLTPMAIDRTDELFVKACAYIEQRRGTRYLPTESRRKDFMYWARQYGAELVFEVIKHRVDIFMRTHVDGKHMAKYARLETILRQNNFPKYLSEYQDEHSR